MTGYKAICWAAIIFFFFAGCGLLGMHDTFKGTALIIISTVAGFLILKVKPSVKVKPSIIYAAKNWILNVLLSPLIFLATTYFADHQKFTFFTADLINWYTGMAGIFLITLLFPWMFATMIYNNFRPPVKSVSQLKALILFEIILLWLFVIISVRPPHNMLDNLFVLSPVIVTIGSILYFSIVRDDPHQGLQSQLQPPSTPV